MLLKKYQDLALEKKWNKPLLGIATTFSYISELDFILTIETPALINVSEDVPIDVLCFELIGFGTCMQLHLLTLCK